MTDRTSAPLGDAEIDELQRLLDRVPPPLQPLDVMALDGFLGGVLLQPRPVPAAQWQRWITDLDGRPLPAAFDARRLHELAQARHHEVDQAIAARDWFDPWVFPLDDDSAPSATVLPWVAGFAAAMETFPGVMQLSDPALPEPLALIYRHFDADDLEDADELLALIDTLEPAADLAEAVQDLVRAVMLIADVTRPRTATAQTSRAPAPRSRSGRRGR